MKPRRIDAVLLLACSWAAGACLALSPWATAAACAAIAAVMLRLGHRRLPMLALLVVALGGARAHWQLERGWRDYHHTVTQLSQPSRCGLRGRVIHSPLVLRAGRPTSQDDPPVFGQARIDVAVEQLRCGERWAPAGTLHVRLYGAPESLARDDRVELVADIAPRRLFINPDVPDPRRQLALSGISASGSIIDIESVTPGHSLWSLIDHARASIRKRIEATYAPHIAPMARALVLGETDLNSDDREAYRLSGLAHLLAVSGTHLVIAVIALAKALGYLLRYVAPLARRVEVARVAALLCIPASWLYAEIAGGGGSAYRAAAMLSVAMAAKAMGERPDALRAFGWSLLGGALVQPLAACDLSFALSVGATAGLLVANRPIRKIQRWCGRGLGALVGAFATTIAAMLGCLPVLLSIAPEVPLAGIAANVLAAPVGELAALPLCLAHAVLWWWPAAEQGAAVLAMGALHIVNAIAYAATDAAWGLRLPSPTAWQLAIVAVGALAAAVCVGRARWAWIALALLGCGAGEWLARAQGRPVGRLRITVVDVGQGDGLLIDLPDGRLMMVDGGGLFGSPVDPGRRALMPLLRARRRSRIDIAVLSHPHPDHYSGWLTTMEQLEVGELWDSGLARVQKPHGQLVKRMDRLAQRGTKVVALSQLCAGPIFAGRAVIEVLSPCPRFDIQRNTNDNSLVIRIRLGKRTALLAGDAEHAQEALLMAHPERLRADFLKVGHHGSRTSTGSDFAAAVSPSVAAISCGVRNRFGHPHAPTLRTLKALSTTTLRTDHGGAIVWQTDGASQSWFQQRTWEQ
ncbi:MAG TPA: DUF4131 domain-containing protein [Sorangium sp.]|nr:DUF4131 domain-containing protein [Sorangium sp.]